MDRESGSPTLLCPSAIDDDPDLLTLVKAALAGDADLEVLALDDPAAAPEIIRRTHPQIVLVDLMMPGVSGMELL